MNTPIQDAMVNDGLQNVITSIGTTRDPSIYDTFTIVEMKQVELDAAYRNWIVAKCVDVPVDDAFKKDRYVTMEDKDQDQAKRFYELEIELNVKERMIEAAKYGRLYGGAIVIIGTDDPEWSAPLTEKSKITHLTTLSRYDVTKVELNKKDIRKSNYRKPEFYHVGNEKIHYTRVIQFDGDKLPFSAYETNGNWNGSVISRLASAIKPAQSAIQNCSTLVNQLSTDVFKSPGFIDKLKALGENSAIVKRFQMAAFMRSNLNMMILDSEEEYIRTAAQLSGLPETMMSFLKLCAGAADIPATRLIGDSASGLNATGEGDLNNWYDSIATLQNTYYTPRYSQIDPLLCYAIWGLTPVGFKSNWEPLYQNSDQERATTELSRAQRDAVYLDRGILSADIVARQLQEDETYQISDEYLQALESYKEGDQNDVGSEITEINT